MSTDGRQSQGQPGPAGMLNYESLVGTRIADRYEIISLVAQGGMGVVYRARHDLMDRIVAVKMLKPQLVMDEMSVKRFQVEAKAASRLSHPNIIGLHDFGLTEFGLPYLVMDFLTGVSLADLIKQEGQLGVDRAVRIFRQVADALEHAHRNGIIHRDLKPSNIMLVASDHDPDFVKVVDFGVAKIKTFSGQESVSLTQSGEVFGSPVYMSPEQCVGEELDARSDVYAMGIVMYETLTGSLPLVGKDIIQTIMMHKCEDPRSFHEVRPDLYIPDRIEEVVFTALQKEPADRQQSMLDLKEHLLSAVGRSTGDQPLPAVSATGRLSRPAGGKRNTGGLTASGRTTIRAPGSEASSGNTKTALFVGGGLFLLVAAALAAFLLFGQRQSGVQAPPAASPTTATERHPPGRQESKKPREGDARAGSAAGAAGRARPDGGRLTREPKALKRERAAVRGGNRRSGTRTGEPVEPTEPAETSGPAHNESHSWYKFQESERGY